MNEPVKKPPSGRLGTGALRMLLPALATPARSSNDAAAAVARPIVFFLLDGTRDLLVSLS